MGQVEKEIMIDFNVPPLIDKICRGGEHCCNRGKLYLCGIGEGDCNTDNDCSGVLMCGQNNCMKWRGPGGRWDEDDDCCEKRCTPEHPCDEGGGHCDIDADCEGSDRGFMKCGDNYCLNTVYFPRNIFVRNSETFGFTTTDNCCYKPCNKRYHLCGQNEVGCEGNEDCLPGYYCVTTAAQPYCTELNECSPKNGQFEGLLYCGQNTACTNTVGSFTCTCNTGFEDFAEHSGCIDTDECRLRTANCGANTNCWNFPGTFVCTCKVGYTGDPVAGCTDIDECINTDWHNCDNSPGYNAETFGSNGFKYFNVSSSNTGDNKHHTFRFEVAVLRLGYFSVANADLSIVYTGVLKQYNVAIERCKNQSCVTLFSSNSVPSLSISSFNLFFLDIFVDNTSGDTIINVLDKSNTSLCTAKYTEPVPIIIEKVGVKNTGNMEVGYWRNMKKNVIQQICVNTVGSYYCKDNPDEMIAIGFGGHTTNGGVYPNKVIAFTNQKYTCTTHRIDDVQGRYSPGMAELDGWLYICGGHYDGARDPLVDCKKFDLNAEDGAWIAAPNLPNKRRHFQMLTYLSSIYIVGGWDYWYGGSACLNTLHEFNHQTNAWTAKSNLPYPNHRHCSVADVENGRIWMIGGHECYVGDKMGVYYYTVSKNSWTFHSNLISNQALIDPSCGIITKTTGEKWLLVVKGGRGEAVIYYDLTNNVGWNQASNLWGNGAQNYMVMLTLTPYNAFIMGSSTSRYGISLKNIFEFNQETNNFEDKWYYLQNEMYAGQWTTVKKSKNFKALQDCVSLREYAAVCWGGHTTSGSDYPSTWSVLLKDRLRKGDPHLPATCHNKIPNLSPGRFATGVTAVDFKLIVCGGHTYGGPYESSCYSLDTNEYFPVWNSMASMPINRGYYEFTTYGDAAFAIAGHNGADLTQVDRWTETEGWVTMAPYPVTVHRHCSVPDPGYDRIYSMAGNSRYDAYYYTVSSNTWTTMPGLYWSGNNMACVIIRRRATGNKIIVLVGDNISRQQYFDLTVYEANGSGGWMSFTGPQYTSYYSAIVSFSPYESYEVIYVSIYFLLKVDYFRSICTNALLLN